MRFSNFLFLVRMIAYQVLVPGSQSLPLLSIGSLCLLELLSLIFYAVSLKSYYPYLKKILLLSKTLNCACMMVFNLVCLSLALRSKQGAEPVDNLRQNLGVYSVLGSLYIEYLMVVLLMIQSARKQFRLYYYNKKVVVPMMSVLRMTPQIEQIANRRSRERRTGAVYQK